MGDQPNVGHLCVLVWGLCFRHGGSVVSWVRSEQRNTAVGGHPKSRHRLGLAWDVVCDTPEQARLMFSEARELGFHGYTRQDNRCAMHLQDRAAKTA
jgi:hypothetical protein